MSTSRRLQAAGVALASVLLLGGCAAGTHPGAAAKVGNTEITVGDLEKTSDAISGIVKQPVPPSQVLSELVRSALAGQVIADRSITISEAEIAGATKVLVDPQAYNQWVANPASNEFLRDAATALVGQVKLGGGTDLSDPQWQAKGTAGAAVLQEASEKIKIDVSPRYGKWTGKELDPKVSGSLSILSEQTEASQKTAQPQQPGQEGEQPQPEQPQG
ncbi:hypothetical protein GCM10009789_84060 [Kribbella sancticallisti]|uniref:SurA N-terminal domain-containing protein n=1 Tax=Kribbella sancticallisti TaxID=460087 RepID=A0ABP4QTM0_9ACTN